MVGRHPLEPAAGVRDVQHDGAVHVEGDVPHLHLHHVVRRGLGAGRRRERERQQNGPFHGDSLGVVSAI